MGWYVLETQPLCERRVQDRISFIGCNSFLPLMRRQLADNHHKSSRHSPFRTIFPRYLFVNLLPEDRETVGIIKRFDGASRWLGAKSDREFPLAVREVDVLRLQELSQDLCAEQVVMTYERPKPMAVDTLVRILWAPMQDATGKIEFDNGIRADVLLAAAGVVSKISLPRELIQVVGQ